MRICPVSREDAGPLLEIYAYYVKNTAVSFEYEIPSVEEFRSRIASVTASYPYLKAIDEKAPNRILGYAYAGRFHPRKAYEWSVETTVYIRQEERQKGIGGALYEELERILSGMGILNMNACIALPRGTDPYLTLDSMHFHEHMGFALVGTFHNSGYKFGRWYDMIWMEKMIGAHKEGQKPVRLGDWQQYLAV